MRKLVGVLPVFLLAVATAISSMIGISLSHGAGSSIEGKVGCRDVSSTEPQAGVRRDVCLYKGDRVVILTVGRGPYTVPSKDLSNNSILGTSGVGWFIACQRHNDCVEIQQKLGGQLTSGPLLGVSFAG